MEMHRGILIWRFGPTQNVATPERAAHRSRWHVHEFAVQKVLAAIGNCLRGDVHAKIPPCYECGGRQGGGVDGHYGVDHAMQQQWVLEPPIQMVAADRP